MNLSRVAERYYARSREILGTMTLAMTTALETDSVSHNFIVQMIPHHQAAVEMAQNLLQYTTCVPLQELADRIIIEQTRGIETMQDALPDCGRPQNTETELARYAARYRRITAAMFARMVAAREAATLNAGHLLRMPPRHAGAAARALASGAAAPRTLLKKLGLPQAEIRRTRALSFACRCSAERAAAMVAAIPPDERASLPPTLDITCHMCGRTWTVTTNP